ncbi:MAG: GTP 3',8-cyclase MoaA [Desulfobulbaceae bacterium]|nr:MAG: GTP 3',8-cyclase MoaA [Desulfobulbaceae bacterium]
MSQSRRPSPVNASRHGKNNTLVDNHGRAITYLRLAITDRCNLRCRYCMPETGVESVDHSETLRYEELKQLVSILLPMGIEKIRITGGEPLVRRGCVDFMKSLKEDLGVEQIYLTTNGVEVGRYLPQMKALGIAGINLSLDTLNSQHYLAITRRDFFNRVYQALQEILTAHIPLKINSVVAHWTTDDEILHLAALAQKEALTLRFIEHMEFSGNQGEFTHGKEKLFNRIARLLPDYQEIDQPDFSTARLFEHPGFAGKIGIIEGHSRSFCGTCNKIRITPQGMLKACLYDNGVLDLREMLRSGVKDQLISCRIQECLEARYANGRVAQDSCQLNNHQSMASIGG